MEEAEPFRVVQTGPERLELAGELDVAGVGEVQSYLARLDGDVTIDCSGLTFIDAAGLGALVGAHHGCKARGASLVLANPPACVARLLEITGLDAVLQVERDRMCS